jgi:uncharacterized protein involved in exopolysaccharide biosynthesis
MSHADIPLFPPTTSPTGTGFTGRDLWRQWFKYWGTIVGAVLSVSALAFVAAALQPRSYSASAKVWIKTDQQGSPSFLSGVAAYREGQMPDPVNRKIETEMQLLLARSNVETVVRKLHIQPEQLSSTPLKGLLGNAANKPRTPEQTVNAAVDAFMKALKVEAVRSKTAETSSNLLEIKLDTIDGELAAPALNALVEQYQQYGAAQTREQGQATYALISDKMNQAQSELQRIDDEMLKLNIAQGQVKESDVNAPVTSLGNVAKTAAPEMDEGLRMDTMLGSSRMGGSSAVGMMKSQTVTLESKVQELRQVYTDDSEVVRNAKRQLAQAEQRLTRSVTASARLDAQLKKLERARALAEDRYTELRRKLDQIELYLSSAQGESATRVITERAQAPEKPDGKKKLILAVLGPLAGLALGLLLAGIREYFDHRLQSTQDVERYLGMDTLGIVPELHKAKA